MAVNDMDETRKTYLKNLMLYNGIESFGVHATASSGCGRFTYFSCHGCDGQTAYKGHDAPADFIHAKGCEYLKLINDLQID